MSPVGSDTEKSSRAISDAALVKRCLSGQQEAWSQLIDKYKALIYSIPVKYGLPQQDAADVFQATCMELLTHLEDLEEPRALPKWLIQVAYHKCYHWRKQQQRLVSRDGDAALPEPEVPAVAEGIQKHDSGQANAILGGALDFCLILFVYFRLQKLMVVFQRTEPLLSSRLAVGSRRRRGVLRR